MPPEFVVVGHISKDLTSRGPMPGGAALYAALTVAALGHTVGLLTRTGPDIALDPLPPAVELVNVPSPTTTTVENTHTGSARSQTIYAVADPIQTSDVPWGWLDAPVVLLVPIANEFAPSFAARFPKSLVGAGLQGWLRRWDAKGRVRPRSPREALGALPPLGALFASRDDWAGDWEELEEAGSASPILVVTLADKGARLKLGDNWTDLPPIPTDLVDATGAGDVFAAAFMVRLFETRDPHESAAFASIAAALSIRGIGVTAIPTHDEIAARRSQTAPPA